MALELIGSLKRRLESVISVEERRTYYKRPQILFSTSRVPARYAPGIDQRD